VISEAPGKRVKVLVVWMPVIATDLGPPSSSTMARLSDRRVTQFWDPKQALSKRLVDAAKNHPDWLSEDEKATVVKDGQVVWDFVMLFPPGARWQAEPPRPVYHGGPVVRVQEELRSALAKIQ
jgi:hypothetical protein